MTLIAVSADLVMVIDAMDFYRDFFVVFTFSSIIKDLLGVVVGMTGIASQ